MEKVRPKQETRLIDCSIVVVGIGIIVVVLFGIFRRTVDSSEIAILKANLKAIQVEVSFQTAASSEAKHPRVIEAEWFRHDQLPVHPSNTFNVPTIETVLRERAIHPKRIELNSRSKGAYWYNSDNGMIRARVLDQGSPEATLEFYNEVNESSLSITE